MITTYVINYPLIMNPIGLQSDFPSQDQLIDNVVSFANADLDDQAKVRRYFRGMWTPDEIPSLEDCRAIQAEVRTMLLNLASGFDVRDFGDAMRGLEWLPDIRHFRRRDSGIVLKGWLGTQEIPVLGGVQERIVFRWRVQNAPLRAICGLGLATLVQEGLHGRVVECHREGCGNFFLDRKSRGKPRKYCKSAECDRLLNSKRVADSRSGKTKK